jgi:carbamoyl-phosphate synthase large subunit
MNILLTSVGRRSYLVNYFRAALNGRGQVFATDTTLASAGAIAADKAFLVPPANDPSYVETLLKICVEHKVRAVLSLHDWEAPFLAASADRFKDHGIVLVMSRPEVIALCLDKYRTYEFAHEHGLPTPLTFTKIGDARQALSAGRMSFPVVLKPRRGQGSVGLNIIEEDWELETCHRRGLRTCARMKSNDVLSQDGDEAMLIQEFVHGAEYGLDVVNDLAGRFVCCLVKRKIAMRAGETDSAETVRSDVLEAYGRTLGQLLGHVGVLDVDVILVGQTPHLLELNPRFGGHYPFAHVAGADIPAAIVAWLSGEPPREEWLRARPGVTSSKGITLELTPQVESGNASTSSLG